MLKGKKISCLNPTFGIVAVSAPEAVLNPKIYQNGKKALKDRGIKVIEGSTINTQKFYMADSPAMVAEDIHSMFENNSVDAIMCVGGGTTVNKILPYLDIVRIAKRPKPLIGISNPTGLLLALNAGGIVSFHGPTLLWDYGIENAPTNFTHNNLLDILSGFTGKFPKLTTWKTFQNGIAEGRAIGGNIFTLNSVIGTKFCPVNLFDGAILFIEDIGKSYDKIDADLTHLKLLGVFEKIKGVVFGRMCCCNPPDDIKMTFDDMLRFVFTGYDFPIVYDVDFGHFPDLITIPFGCQVRLNATGAEPEIELLEAGVE